MAKPKGGLGKGLSALIRPAVQAERTGEQRGRPVSAGIDSVSHVEISKIRPNPYQPRADFDPKALDELRESIKEKGIIQPVTIRQSGDGTYELISGERRIRAALDLGMQSVPAYIIDVKNDAEMLELALIENLQREHLNPVEIAISYQRLVSDVGLTAEEIAKKVSKDRTTVVNFLRLLKLPKNIQDALRTGTLTIGHARALISLPSEDTQQKIFKRIVKRDLNVRQVENIVRDLGRKASKNAKSSARGSATVEGSIAERIQQILATKVRVNVIDGNRGEIIIEFYSSDDLGRLFDLLSTIEQ
jgi:ParB family chromosome partitioning protein